MKMNNLVYRVFVEKKADYANEGKALLGDLKENLQLNTLDSIRVFNRYDIQGVTEEEFSRACNTIFSEPQVDDTYLTLPEGADYVFAIEFLPGQFDQRADSAAQCVQLLTGGDRPIVRNARVYMLNGKLTEAELASIKNYLINPVESREASLKEFATLEEVYETPEMVKVLDGFIDKDQKALKEEIKTLGLAMDFDDILCCQNYFKNVEKRNPTITEIRMLDTYWSDHCRHTTFATEIVDFDITPSYVKDTYDLYLECKEKLGRSEKPVTLMDIATIAGRYLKHEGELGNLDESEEINACSIKISVDVNGELEDWLLMFKNETHNHPTEIEPFGGAATCLGGAIRDPLSGRSYVYQAMRVTGAADPRKPFEETIPGKLPQRKITQGAAAGYSSYGNQIGLATGLVDEIYHPNYVAKRMEIGAVVAAAPLENVIRTRPEPGDVVILLGGKTGRDGCGGATGSSKSHTMESLESCGSEVQKGNAPEERKIQRLFRNGEVTKLIKRCNDFGAGGVSVAIGELADGLRIDLNKVPKKYEGLDGTELAISESQERMAVVVEAENAKKFMEFAREENIESTIVATVEALPRLQMLWNGQMICDISRDFLDSNGAKKYTKIQVEEPALDKIYQVKVEGKTYKEKFANKLADLNICSKKGLVERFDATIGAGTVTMPFGGKTQTTPTQYMAAKIPVLHGETTTTSVMAYGFNPYISEISPYHGATLAVVESVAKLVAAGIDYKTIYLTFQEYFERLGNDASRWGKPFAALLGGVNAQIKLGIAAIGGKDSMSGTFEDIDVPPTLVSFAISTMASYDVVTPEFKRAGENVYFFKPLYDENKLPDFQSLQIMWEKINNLQIQGAVSAAWALTNGGVGEGIAKMAFGNNIGFEFADSFDKNELFDLCYGGLLVVTDEEMEEEYLVGRTIEEEAIIIGDEKIQIAELVNDWAKPLEKIFPTEVAFNKEKVENISYDRKEAYPVPNIKVARPKVVLPVFPGTNCEYDTMRQFEKYGADCETVIIRNQSSQDLHESVEKMVKVISESNIIALPGGFSGGDEPDGSGKFIATFFRNPYVKEEVQKLLQTRDGLMIGICNGFQALIKLGLVPYGDICDTDANSPTLTFNNISRHQSMMVNTRICSNKSPWLQYTNVGDIHNIAISHGEGKLVAPKEVLEGLIKNGQVATQYVDPMGNATMDMPFNPNGSYLAIEGITSPDGRVLGKMGHSERVGSDITKNVPGNKDQLIFKAGVDYFKL